MRAARDLCGIRHAKPSFQLVIGGSPGGCRETRNGHCDEAIKGAAEQQQALLAIAAHASARGGQGGETLPLHLLHGTSIANSALNPTGSLSQRYTPRFQDAALAGNIRTVDIPGCASVPVLPAGTHTLMSPEFGYTQWVATSGCPLRLANHAADMLAFHRSYIFALVERYGGVVDDAVRAAVKRFVACNIAACWPPDEEHAALVMDTLCMFSSQPDAERGYLFQCELGHDRFRLAGAQCYKRVDGVRCKKRCVNGVGGGQITRAAETHHENLFAIYAYVTGYDDQELLDALMLDAGTLGVMDGEPFTVDRRAAVTLGFTAGLEKFKDSTAAELTDNFVRTVVFKLVSPRIKVLGHIDRKLFEHGVVAAGNLVLLRRLAAAAGGAAGGGAAAAS